MGIMSKLLRRTPVYTVLLALLLAVGVAFSSIGFAFYQSARLQQMNIRNGYTTAVIPYNEKYPGFMPVPSGTLFPDVYTEQTSMADLLRDAPVEYQLDQRVCLIAAVQGMESWTQAVEMFQYFSPHDDPYSISVFAVRCDSVELQTNTYETYDKLYDKDGKLLEEGMVTQYDRLYDCTFSVLEPLCYMKRGDPTVVYADTELGTERATDLPPEKLHFLTKLVNPDGTALFEEGKTYLVRGRCPVNTSGTPTGELELTNGAVTTGIEDIILDDTSYQLISNDTLPLYTQYDGDLEDFLNSEEGSVWRDTIIPGVKQNYCAVKLMLTDQLNSMYWFNTGDASLLEGRMPTEEEYQEGKDVCVISADYAQMNDLSVGDSLTMDLYQPRIALNFDRGSAESNVYMLIDSCMAENSLEMQKEYTVVGIYTAPAYAFGCYAFNPDVVFAPKASVPGATEMEEDGTYIPLLNSAMIPNGSSQQLLEFLEAKGYKDSVLLLDQGYTEASDAVDALMANALRLFAAGTAVLIVTAGLFLFLCLHKMRPTVVSMRRMGVRGTECWRQIQLAMVPVMTAAVVLGTAGSIALFGRIGQLLLSTQMELPLLAVLLDAVGKLIFLLLLESLCARGLTKVGLMQKGKRKKT